MVWQYAGSHELVYIHELRAVVFSGEMILGVYPEGDADEFLPFVKLPS